MKPYCMLLNYLSGFLLQVQPEKVKDLKSKLLKACDGDFNNGFDSSEKNQINIEQTIANTPIDKIG